MNKDKFYQEALPIMRAAVIELQPQVRGVRVKLDEPVGESSIALSAFFETSRAGTDMLQLIVLFQIIDGLDVVDAQVVWDHDSLYIEADLPDRGFVPTTSENLEHLLAELPRLIAAFKAAVLRGRPGDV